MKARGIAGEGEKGALFSVFLDQCYGHKVSVPPSFCREVKYGLSAPTSPKFASSLTSDSSARRGQRDPALQRGNKQGGEAKSSLHGLQVPLNPRNPPRAPHHSFQLLLGPFRAKLGVCLSLWVALGSELLPPALLKFQLYPANLQGLGIHRHFS